VNIMRAFEGFDSTVGGRWRHFLADQNAATAIEYAMIAAGVGAFIAATVMGLGSSLKETFYDKLASILP
jgi:Flp pilus assembly pilin Flp